MSRSKHTDPKEIRAARRLRAPREGRGAGDLSRRRELDPLARVGSSRAAIPQGQAAGEGCANSRPRIVRGAIRGEATARADERTQPLSTGSGVMLVGDGIENPANALTMIHAAAMFGARCRFRDTQGR